MNYKQHLLFGIVILLLFIGFMHWKFSWYPITIIMYSQIILIMFISPLIPDLDHQNGKLSQIFLGSGLFIAFTGIILWFISDTTSLTFNWKPLIIIGVVLAFVTFITGQITKHRGFFHSILFCVVYGTIIWLITAFNLQLSILAFIGCFSHLIADKVYKLA